MTLGKVKTATAVSGAGTVANGLNALLRAGVVLTLILASSAAGRAQIASQDDGRPPQTSASNAAAHLLLPLRSTSSRYPGIWFSTRRISGPLPFTFPRNSGTGPFPLFWLAVC